MSDSIVETNDAAVQPAEIPTARSQLFIAIHPDDPEPMRTVATLLADRERKNQGVDTEMAVITAAMRLSADYAWGWQCNIAMSFVDEGGDPAMAHRAAARFLKILAHVDMTQHPNFADSQPKEAP